MKRKKTKESLRISLLMVTLIPIIALTIIIVTFTSYRTKKTIRDEEKEAMYDIACLLNGMLDVKYPGDYGLMKSDKYVALSKGGVPIDIYDELEAYYDVTGVEVTIFYNDVRMITTLCDRNDESMQGTTSNYVITEDVLKGDEGHFYTNVKVGSKLYYAYYEPLHNSDGKACGMIAILKSADTIKHIVNRATIPIYGISALVMLLAGIISVMYSQKIIEHFNSIKKCLVAMEHDNYNVEMNPKLRNRKDELGEMANAVISMRGVIKKFTEVDGLTSVFNRRYSHKRLEEMIKNAKKSGEKYSLCMCDIDYFKKVNDTYGHDAGDMVLIKVAYELKKFMQGKGFVARWGGEEFLLVFDKFDATVSAPLVEQLRMEIQELRFSFDMDKQITMSFGVADGAHLESDELVKLADSRLYIAKNNGRNRVVCSDE